MQIPKFTFLKVELIAGFSTFLTMSYILVLNPLLLHKVGINLNSAYTATIITAVISTLIMAFYAKVPFAAAPVPSITTFFVSYVCLELKIPWQSALAAVFLSGILSIIMTKFAIRSKLVNRMSESDTISNGILTALCGFLIATGLKQAHLVDYKYGMISSFNLTNYKEAFILLLGLLTTLILSTKKFKTPAAPLIGILFASLLAMSFGIYSNIDALTSNKSTSSFFQMDFGYFFSNFSLELIITVLIFFIIDFFAGIGKFVGLFSAINSSNNQLENYENKFNKSLYADGFGNLVGATTGASSVAVFVSSAVGISVGGKSGWTAFFIAIFIALSYFLMPIIGSIPTVAISGTLIYIGFLLLPFQQIKKHSNIRLIIYLSATLLTFITYNLALGILIVFIANTIQILKRGIILNDSMIIIVTVLLSVAVSVKYFI